jgi:primosomal protein N' (replication factor Y) (superfamily II helicase)
VTELQTLFAHVLVPVPVPKTYTYRVPHDWNDWIHEGLRVAVQFGPKKIYAGVILSLSDSPPVGYQAAYLLDVLDDAPIVNHRQLQFWQWVAKYYMCYMGEVMATALPAGYRLQSETKILLHPDADLESVIRSELEDIEWQILELLGHKDGLSLDEIHQKLAVKNVLKHVKSLYLRGLVVMEEELKENYRPKYEEFLELGLIWGDAERANAALGVMERRAQKQYEAMMHVLGTGKREMPVETIVKGMGVERAVLKQLEKKTFVTLVKRRRDHLQVTRGVAQDYQLTALQKTALDVVRNAFEAQQPALLFGVTGSGKTHIYMELVKEALASGKQVLYLLPEVALTEHLVAKMSTFFTG